MGLCTDAGWRDDCIKAESLAGRRTEKKESEERENRKNEKGKNKGKEIGKRRKEDERERLMWKRASMTVEAAILLPLAIVLLLFGVTAALYLHDINVSLAHMQEITSYGRMLLWQQEEGRIRGKAEEIEGKGKLGALSGELNLEISGNSITASEENQPRILFQSWFSALGWEQFSAVQTADREKVLNPMKIIRRCRLVESIGE